MVSFYVPPQPHKPDVQVVVRWRNGHASHQEIAALRQLLPALRDRPISEVFREARGMPEWVLAICNPGDAQRLRDQAERAGLVAAVEPVVAPDLTIVTDDEVVAGLTGDGLSVADHFLMAGLVCSINPHGQLMGLSIDDEALALATTAYLRRAGVPEYASYQDFVAGYQPKARPDPAGEER